MAFATAETIARAARYHRESMRHLQLRQSCGLPVDEALIGISRHLALIEERKLEQLFGMALTPDGDLCDIPSMEVAA